MSRVSKPDLIASEARIHDVGPPSAWLVVISKGGCERMVRDRLQAQGFEVYLPLVPVQGEAALRRGVGSAPLFPRFVFARATLDAYRWQAIFSTIGVQRVLCDPRKPKGVRPEFIDRIRAFEIEGLVELGLRDPARPLAAAPTKDPRKWTKLGDIVAGLRAERIDTNRSTVLVSLLSEGRAALTQDIRRI